jgi:hypothetical protein
MNKREELEAKAKEPPNQYRLRKLIRVSLVDLSYALAIKKSTREQQPWVNSREICT